MADVGERIVALETTLHGSGGVMERLKELSIALEEVKKTVWKATGAAMVIYAAVEIWSRH